MPNSFLRERSYHVENTSSRPITEVKQRRAWLVLGWVTAWEHHVMLTFFLFFIIVSLRSTLSLPFQFLATSISESTRATTQTMRPHCLFSSASDLEKNSPRTLNSM